MASNNNHNGNHNQPRRKRNKKPVKRYSEEYSNRPNPYTGYSADGNYHPEAMKRPPSDSSPAGRKPSQAVPEAPGQNLNAAMADAVWPPASAQTPPTVNVPPPKWAVSNNLTRQQVFQQQEPQSGSTSPQPAETQPQNEAPRSDGGQGAAATHRSGTHRRKNYDREENARNRAAKTEAKRAAVEKIARGVAAHSVSEQMIDDISSISRVMETVPEQQKQPRQENPNHINWEEFYDAAFPPKAQESSKFAGKKSKSPKKRVDFKEDAPSGADAPMIVRPVMLGEDDLLPYDKIARENAMEAGMASGSLPQQNAPATPAAADVPQEPAAVPEPSAVPEPTGAAALVDEARVIPTPQNEKETSHDKPEENLSEKPWNTADMLDMLEIGSGDDGDAIDDISGAVTTATIEEILFAVEQQKKYDSRQATDAAERSREFLLGDSFLFSGEESGEWDEAIPPRADDSGQQDDQDEIPYIPGSALIDGESNEEESVPSEEDIGEKVDLSIFLGDRSAPDDEEAAPEPSRPVAEEAAPKPAQPVAEEAAPKPAQPVAEEAAPEPSRPVAEEAAPEPSRPVAEEAAPVPSRPVAEEAAPEPSRPVAEEAAPEPSRPVAEEAAPEPAQPVAEEAAPEPAQPVAEEATPEPSRPVAEEATPVPSQPVAEEAIPEPSRPVAEEATPEPSRPVADVVIADLEDDIFGASQVTAPETAEKPEKKAGGTAVEDKIEKLAEAAELAETFRQENEDLQPETGSTIPDNGIFSVSIEDVSVVPQVTFADGEDSANRKYSPHSPSQEQDGNVFESVLIVDENPGIIDQELSRNQNDQLFLHTREQTDNPTSVFKLPDGPIVFPTDIDDAEFQEHWLDEEKDGDDMASRSKRARRRMSAFIGAVALVFAVMILLSAVNTVVTGFNNIGNTGEKKTEYLDFISDVVVCDPAPFESVEKADNKVLLQCSIWRALRELDETEGYEHKSDATNKILLPEENVQNAAKELFGDDVQLNLDILNESDGSAIYYYDSIDRCFHITRSGIVGPSPVITKIAQKSDYISLIVGYTSQEEMTITSEDEDQVDCYKYMEYVLALRYDGSYYIQSIRNYVEE